MSGNVFNLTGLLIAYCGSHFGVFMGFVCECVYLSVYVFLVACTTSRLLVSLNERLSEKLVLTLAPKLYFTH